MCTDAPPTRESTVTFSNRYSELSKYSPLAHLPSIKELQAAPEQAAIDQGGESVVLTRSKDYQSMAQHATQQDEVKPLR